MRYLGFLGLLSGLRHWENRNKGAAFQAFVEFHSAFGSCKDCVVLAHANARAWPHLCAALAHDDVTGNYGFAAEFLHAKTTTG
jgi:hypothetical protein